MNAAKLRECYQQTQVLLSELQALGADSYGIDRANAKHQQLVRLAIQLKHGTESLADQESASIWKERFAKLHEDLVSVTALRLQRDGQSSEQFWDGCVRLLYAGASAYTQMEAEIANLQAQQHIQVEERTKLDAVLQNSNQQQEATAKEILELRTRVVVLQQEVQRRDADARDLQQQLQVTLKEREALHAERENLLMERRKNAQVLERQTKVIGQLMERSESNIRERDEAVETLKQVDEDNHMLRVNLHQHTLMVEKLIGLNTEVMDTANRHALLREELQRQLQEERRSRLEKGIGNRTCNGQDTHDAEHSMEEDAVPVSTSAQVEDVGPAEERSFDQSHAAVPRTYSWKSQDSDGGEETWRKEHENGNNRPVGDDGRTTSHGDSLSNRQQAAALERQNGDNDSSKPQEHGKDGAEKDHQKARAWTSEMLELSYNAAHEKVQEDEERKAALSEESRIESKGRGIAGGAKNMLRNVGGKAKGFLFYVAGADKVG